MSASVWLLEVEEQTRRRAKLTVKSVSSSFDEEFSGLSSSLLVFSSFLSFLTTKFISWCERGCCTKSLFSFCRNRKPIQPKSTLKRQKIHFSHLNSLPSWLQWWWWYRFHFRSSFFLLQESSASNTRKSRESDRNFLVHLLLLVWSSKNVIMLVLVMTFTRLVYGLMLSCFKRW